MNTVQNYTGTCECCGKTEIFSSHTWRYLDDMHHGLRRLHPGHEPGPGDMRNLRTGKNLFWLMNSKREEHGLKPISVVPTSLCKFCNPRPAPKWTVVYGHDEDLSLCCSKHLTLSDTLAKRKNLLKSWSRTYYAIERI